MSATLVWWVMLQVVALAALPLCLTLFRRLPDRGYALSKAFGLILLGYLFWILNIARILPNSGGGIWIALLLIMAGSALLFWRRRDELVAFAREHRWLIAATEIILFVSFITAAFLRSYVADLGGTEKPMDFMLLNAMTRGAHFPPPDAWLAGKNVSYYYFGYLIVSVMTRLSALETSVGFNLGLAMIAALAVTGAFGLVYNLTAPRAQRERESGPGTPAKGFTAPVLWRPICFGVVAALLLVVIGNIEGLLETLAARGVGPQGFWNWVGIRDPSTHALSLSAYQSHSWYPDKYWFWWHATRILDGGVGIHEFPFFSFLLGDLHPHVMALPFVLLTLGVALTLLRSDEPLDLVVWLERPLALAAFAIILGGLAFLNTWDMPTMAFVVALLALLRNRILAGGWSWGLALDTAGFVLPLLIASLLAYSPFFFGGFSSQASGFTAEAATGSGLFHTLLIWGPFAVIILPYALWRLRSHDRPIRREEVLWALAPALAILLLWAIWNVLAVHEVNGKLQSGFGLDHLLGWLPKTVRPNEVLNVDAQPISLGTRIANRGWNWLTFFVLAGSLGLLALALYREVESAKREAEERLGHIFALALSLTAALLILGVEFVYIQDGFSSRMNTIFKLYYQAWVLLSVAGGFALFEMARGWRFSIPKVPKVAVTIVNAGDWSLGELVVATSTIAGVVVGLVIGRDAFTRIFGLLIGGGVFFAFSAAGTLIWRHIDAIDSPERPAGALSWRSAWAGAVAALLIAAFAYPLTAAYSRTNGFTGLRTLNGLDALGPDERQAIEWLSDQSGQPVIAEAPGEDYKIETGGLFSASSGLPSILQWPGHELQWRGNSTDQAGRSEDLDTLYTSATAGEVQAVLQKYGIRFVIVGPAEREKYTDETTGKKVNVSEMTTLFEQAFQQGGVTIYRVRPGILTQVKRE